ncbi:hypothetical protein P7K49_005973 [Saguinus oedipus]|uniref:Uncharacterized protein n=1 Tax=Saguinus oedipus TaxID=9490 RepID=A0ABQ9W124_SAGOE|nr:hypothetical protein P7K49_005973 [Saguinus oedipus]
MNLHTSWNGTQGPAWPWQASSSKSFWPTGKGGHGRREFHCSGWASEGSDLVELLLGPRVQGGGGSSGSPTHDANIWYLASSKGLSHARMENGNDTNEKHPTSLTLDKNHALPASKTEAAVTPQEAGKKLAPSHTYEATPWCLSLLVSLRAWLLPPGCAAPVKLGEARNPGGLLEAVAGKQRRGAEEGSRQARLPLLIL